MQLRMNEDFYFNIFYFLRVWLVGDEMFTTTIL